MEFVNKVKFLLGFPISEATCNECTQGVPNFVTAFAVNVRAMNRCYTSMFTTPAHADATTRMPSGIALEDLVKFFELSKDDLNSDIPDITIGGKLNDYNLYRALCNTQKRYESILALWFWGYLELADLYMTNILIDIRNIYDYDLIRKQYNSYSGSHKVHFPQAKLYATHNPNWMKAMFRSDSALIEYFNLCAGNSPNYALPCDYMNHVNTTYSWWNPSHDYKGDSEPIPYSRIGIPVFVRGEDYFNFLRLNPRADGNPMCISEDDQKLIEDQRLIKDQAEGDLSEESFEVEEPPADDSEPEDTVAYAEEMEKYFNLTTEPPAKCRGEKTKKSAKQRKQDRRKMLRQKNCFKPDYRKSFPTLPLKFDQDALPKISEYIKPTEVLEPIVLSEPIVSPEPIVSSETLDPQETLEYSEIDPEDLLDNSASSSILPPSSHVEDSASPTSGRERSAYSKAMTSCQRTPAFAHLHKTLSANSYALVDGSNVSPPVLLTFISALRNESNLAHIHLVFDSEPLFRWDLWGQGKVSYEVATRTSLRKNSADILIGFRLATLVHTLDYTKFVLISSDADFACLCKDMQDRLVVITEESAVSDRYLEFLNSNDISNYVLQDFTENCLLQKLLKMKGAFDTDLAMNILSNGLR